MQVLIAIVSLLTGLLFMFGAVLVAVGAAKLRGLIEPHSAPTTLIVAFVDAVSFIVACLSTMGWIYQYIMLLRGTAGRLDG